MQLFTRVLNILQTFSIGFILEKLFDHRNILKKIIKIIKYYRKYYRNMKIIMYLIY